jgi:hypothetical protein
VAGRMGEESLWFYFGVNGVVGMLDVEKLL